MKTTLEIPDHVFRRAKAKAAQRGIPLRQFVTEAVEEKLVRSAPGRDKPWMEMFGRLRHLRQETGRIQRLIDSEFERIERKISDYPRWFWTRTLCPPSQTGTLAPSRSLAMLT